MSEYHSPVLLTTSVNALNVKPDGVYVDVTFGGGGHSGEILGRLEAGHLFAFDQDSDVLPNLPNDNRFTFVKSNYRFIKQFLRFYKSTEIDGILADLGVSSHHFDSTERGFSFRFNSGLDMRMNTSSGNTAYKVVNEYTEEKLADVFYFFGEIKNARLLASKVCEKRTLNPIKTTFELKEIIAGCTNARQEIKYLSQAFQAIRIEVNGELKALQEMLKNGADVLKSGGRFSVITYHSLEDRLVKNFFKSGNFSGKVDKDFYGNIQSPFRLVNKKVIIPGDAELAENTRSRSAKLRVAEKI